MKQINFSDIGVVVNSMEELEEIFLTYTALDISFVDLFKDHCITAQQRNFVGYCIQATKGGLKTTIEEDYLYVSILKYPITHSIDKLDFAVAYRLLKSNQSDELTAHLNKYCKEYK